jgi:exopolysaccharide biosynthesis polyprenyl glycosylphosphotransferase
MSTLVTASSIDRSGLRAVGHAKRHARDFADRQPIPGATTLATIETAYLLLALTGVLIGTNRNQMPQGLDNFLSMRVTLWNVLLLALLATIWRVVFRVGGLYSVGGVRVASIERHRVVLACGAAAVAGLIIPLLSVGGGLRAGSLVYFFVATMAGTLAIRQIRRAVARRRQRRRVLIVGTGLRAVALWQRMADDDVFDYELTGFLDTADSTPANEEVAQRSLGTLATLEPLLMQHAIDEVRIALPVKSHYLDIQDAIRVCERVGVQAKYQADLFDSEVAWPRYDDSSSPTVTLHVVPNDRRLVIKRILDVVGATVALIVLSPALALTAVAVKATSEGPVLFAQERYGLNRRRFRMFKFRTMRLDAEQLQAALEARNQADGPVFKIFDDPRITRLGRLLRRTSIDELPQLVNVLRGEMSLVGPRPLPLRDVMRFTSAADMRRFSVRPGLTCLWQISGRSSLSFTDWIRLDLKYIDGWSLALDLMILLRTLPAVLSGNGAR